MNRQPLTQRRALLRYLRKRKSITPRDAWQLFGCYRLGARIFELRKLGHRIVTTMEDDGARRWARYSLLKGAR